MRQDEPTRVVSDQRGPDGPAGHQGTFTRRFGVCVPQLQTHLIVNTIDFLDV